VENVVCISLQNLGKCRLEKAGGWKDNIKMDCEDRRWMELAQQSVQLNGGLLCWWCELRGLLLQCYTRVSSGVTHRNLAYSNTMNPSCIRWGISGRRIGLSEGLNMYRTTQHRKTRTYTQDSRGTRISGPEFERANINKKHVLAVQNHSYDRKQVLNVKELGTRGKQ